MVSLEAVAARATQNLEVATDNRCRVALSTPPRASPLPLLHATSVLTVDKGRDNVVTTASHHPPRRCAPPVHSTHRFLFSR